jgi:hypothetical protein
MSETSIRIRTTPEELQLLNDTAHAETTTEFLSEDGSTGQGRLTYGVTVLPDAQQGHCAIESNTITIYITQDDLHQLNQPKSKGVYLRHENENQRFSAYVEPDIPMKRKSKEDKWLQGDDTPTS